MHKTLTILMTTLALTGWAQVASVPYASEIGGEGALDTGWTVIDLDGDGKTWINDSYTSSRGYEVAGTAHGAFAQWDRTNSKNDLLISPAIHLEEGRDYKITFWVKTSGDTEAMQLLMSNGATAANFENAQVLLDLPAYQNNTAFERMTVTLANRGEDDYHFAFKACSAPYMGYIYLTGFAVGIDAVTPGAPTGLAAVVSEGDDPAVDLTWALPTVTDEGEPLDASAITGVRVLRDGTLAATLAAGTTTWHDSAAAGLTAGVHTYEVCGLAGEAVGVAARLTTPYVGALPAQALPWHSDLSSTEAVGDLWTVIKGPASTQSRQWAYTYSSYNPYFGFAATTGVEDDYLVTPPLKVEQAGAYKVTFEWGAGYLRGEKLELLMGRGRSLAAMTATVATFTSKSDTGTKYAYEATFEADEPGIYYLALRACCPAVTNRQGYGNTYNIYSVAVERNTIVPAHVADLTATPAADGTATVELAWTNPATTNAGGTLGALERVEVLRAQVTGTSYARRAGEWAVVATLTDAEPGAAATYDDAVPAPGYYAYRVLPYGAGGPAEGDPTIVFTDWVGDRAQTLPYACDFADQSHFDTFYTVLDANGDGNTFAWTSGYQVRFNHGGTEADDWLLSPAFDLEPGYYKVTLGYNGNGSAMVLGTATGTDAAGFETLESISAPAYGNFTRELTFEVAEAGRRHIAIHDVSPATASYLQIKSLLVERTAVLPGVATGLTATADDRSVTLAWTNPATTNIDGLALEAIDHAVVLRNGEQVATLTEGLTPGAQATYTDVVPAVGPYTYSVEIYNANGKSEADAPTVALDWVGGGLDLPYTADFDRWTIVNANGDSQTYTDEDEFGSWTWTEEFTWAVSGSRLYYGYNTRQADDWAVSPRIELPESGTAKVIVTSGTTSGHSVEWDLAVADTPDYEAMAVVASVTTTTGFTAGDLNGDCSVDVEDLNMLINEILDVDGSATSGATPDLNLDGEIDIQDVNLLVNLTLGLDTGDVTAVQRDVITLTGVPGTRAIGLHAKQAGDITIYTLKVIAADGE